MLFLSRLIGQDVMVEEAGLGGMAGRLTDLTVRLDARGGPQLVERLLLERRGGHRQLLSWDAVVRLEADRPVVAAGVSGSPAGELTDDEILLARDVLDTQVIDVAGQRLARVADVVLRLTGEALLEVIGVEVGFGAVLRRLGLNRLVPNRTADVVAWNDLHLTSERGHSIQLAAARSAVHRLDTQGLAALVSRIDTESATEILASKAPDVAAEVVRAADPDIGERVLRAMPGPLSARIVAAMPTEHAGRWRERLHRPALLRRHFLRSAVWSRRHLNWRLR